MCLGVGGKVWETTGKWGASFRDGQESGEGQAFEVDRKVGASFRRRPEMGEALEDDRNVSIGL